MYAADKRLLSLDACRLLHTWQNNIPQLGAAGLFQMSDPLTPAHMHKEGKYTEGRSKGQRIWVSWVHVAEIPIHLH